MPAWAVLLILGLVLALVFHGVVATIGIILIVVAAVALLFGVVR
jgi:hypothetical protein